jgi:hypothetical protein
MSRPAGVASRIVLTLVQVIAFCALFLVGGYWAEIRLAMEVRAMQQHTAQPAMLPLWKLHISSSLDYVANGLVYAGVLLVLILLFEILRRRLRPWAALTLLAFLLSFVLSLIAHSGFVPLSTS